MDPDTLHAIGIFVRNDDVIDTRFPDPAAARDWLREDGKSEERDHGAHLPVIGLRSSAAWAAPSPYGRAG